MKKLVLSVICAMGMAGTFGAHAQTMPKARLFAEGTIATPGAFAATFTPNGKAVYFAKDERKTLDRISLLRSQWMDGAWAAPEVLEFATRYNNVDPFLSPDGTRLFFASNRPLDGKNRDAPALWVVEKKGNGWGEPCPVLKEHLAKPGTVAVFPSPVKSGSLYFAGHLLDPAPLGKDDIYRARHTETGYLVPENLGPPINTVHQEYDAYVAADESYMIFASDRPGGFGASDLYISIWKNGKWTEPLNMGPSVNSESGLCCPSVSPDGKHFYFTTSLNGKQGIYEIDFPALTRALGIEFPALDKN